MLSTRQLGFQPLTLTTVGFGAWGIGGTAYGPTEDSVSLEALRTAWDLGVRFYDTADVYGKGRSESLIAEAIGPHRDQAIIASKCGFNFYEGTDRPTFDGAYIRRACEESLKRLKTHVIDIYQLHNPPRGVLQHDEARETLLALKHEGKIRIPAVSVQKADDAWFVLAERDFGAIQVIYNAIDQRPKVEGILDTARMDGVGIIARVPLAYGFLTGKYQANHQFGPLDHRARRPASEVAHALHRTARCEQLVKAGAADSLVELALRFAISDPGVTSVIPGIKTPEQMREAVAAVEKGPLSEAVLHELYGLGRAWASEDMHVMA